MAGDDRRLDAPRAPQFAQTDLDRIERRLGVGHLVNGGRVARSSCLRVKHGEQSGRLLHYLAEQFVAAVDDRAKDRLAFIKLAPHVYILRAVAGEQENDLRRAVGRAGGTDHCVGVGCTPRAGIGEEFGQFALRFVERIALRQAQRAFCGGC